MTSQHAKWLKVAKELSWRKGISSLNYILSSHIWQQDHNGYTHQDPGFLNHLVTKKADVTRIYLPFDANTLLSCADHVLRTKNYINVIVASKHERPQWLNIEDAMKLIKDSEDKLIASKYENVYHTKFIARRDYEILRYYINHCK